MNRTIRVGGAPPAPAVRCLIGLGMCAALACSAPSDEAAPAPEPGSVVVTQWNDSTELFLEYPHPVAGQATGNWAIHMTSRKDYQPIRAGTLTVRFTAGAVTAHTFVIDAVARDGIFLLDPVVERPGRYEVELTLESDQVHSRHVLPDVQVFARASEVPAASGEDDGGIAFLKEQQWQIPFAVEQATDDTVRRTVGAPGEIVAPDGALVEVSAPVDGIASAEANRNAPSVGQHVRAGQVLVVLLPISQDGGSAEVRARVERLEREIARATRLLAAGAIPARRLDEARHDLGVATAQADALGATGDDDYRLRLTSPIGGVVARRGFVPGGRVSAAEPLFTIVDPRVAWLRAQVPASVAASIPADATATFTVEGMTDIHRTSRVIAVGNVLDPSTRTVPVVFQVAAAGSLFTFGQLARAAVPVGGVVSGVVIPNGGIVDDNGTPVAYVQASGETFERRTLILGATDGTRTRVESGIAAGEMVVTRGAYQVRLASMSDGEFAGGHAH